jgi:hypothetical protein
MKEVVVDSSILTVFSDMDINVIKMEDEVQVTLIIRAFPVHVFTYPWFYFSILRSINILSIAKFQSILPVSNLLQAYQGL